MRRGLIFLAFIGGIFLLGNFLRAAEIDVIPVNIGEACDSAGWSSFNCATTTASSNPYLALIKDTSMLMSPSLDLTSFGTAKTDFKARTYNGTTTSSAEITISISIDNSVTWRELAKTTPIDNTLKTQTEVDLSSYIGGIVRLKWETLSATGSKGVGVDDLRIYGDLVTPPITPTTTPFLAGAGDLVINEFLSDPSDGEKEWVEFFNLTTSTIDLTNWTISDNASTSTLSGAIDSVGFFVLEFSASRLNNSGDVLTLRDASGAVINQISYGDYDDGDASDNAPAPDKSYSVARSTDGVDTGSDQNDFAETITPTKGMTNVITPKPVPPSSGGGTGGGTSNPPATPKPVVPKTPLEPEINPLDYQDAKIVINELYPNPADNEAEDEFVELKNLGDKEIKLNGWILADASNRKYKMKAGVIPAKGFFLIKRKDSKIALNNTGQESAKLYFPDNKLADETSYHGKDTEDQSYSRDAENKWRWTETITPNAENVFSVEKPAEPPIAVISTDEEAETGDWVNFDAGESSDPQDQKLKYVWNFGDGKTSRSEAVHHRYGKPGDYKIILVVTNEAGLKGQAEKILRISASASTAAKAGASQIAKNFAGEVPLESVRDLAVGTKLKVKGLVSVEPGVLGVQIFYVAGSGLQIYSYKKDFPALKLGNYIEVVGELAESGGERRLKIQTKNDIKILDSATKPVAPHELTIGEIGEENEGWLVKVSGEVIEVKGNNVYLDDGSDEILVYLKTSAGLKNSNFQPGEKIMVTGIVSQTKTGYRLLPRYESDIERGQVLGEKIMAEDPPASASKINYYLLAIIGFLVAVIVWQVWQFNKIKQKNRT